MKKYTILVLLSVLVISGCAQEVSEPVAPPIEEDIKEEIVEVEPVVQEPKALLVTIAITADKVMVPDQVTIEAGTTVRWTNEETRPFLHSLIILPSGINLPKTGDVLARSGNFKPGEFWEYTFVEKGHYTNYILIAAYLDAFTLHALSLTGYITRMTLKTKLSFKHMTQLRMQDLSKPKI